MEYETKSGRAGPSNPTSPRQSVRKNLDFEPLSTTALILEDRPANLPAKSAEEAQKHRQQYEEMVAQAKKRELKEAQKRKKQLEDRCKLEESIGTAALTWNQDILPNWRTVCTSRRVRDLWWQGIPPSVRGKVWSLAMGNELNITHEEYGVMMRTDHILLLCILGAALLSSVICKNEIGPEDCCFKFYPRRVNKKLIRSYYLTDDRCPKTGVILITQKSRHICADPTLSWVESIMRNVDETSF